MSGFRERARGPVSRGGLGTRAPLAGLVPASLLLATMVLSGRPVSVSAQASFEPTHIERTGSVEFQASPAEVFAALEPRGKRLRAPAWDVELLYPTSGEGLPGAVLRQTHKRAGIQQIWTVVESDPPNRIKYVIFVPDMETWEFDMHLSENATGGTVMHVEHRITSLSEGANPDVQQFADGFDAYLERWQVAVADVADQLKN